jgi:hypothetical protein
MYDAGQAVSRSTGILLRRKLVGDERGVYDATPGANRRVIHIMVGDVVTYRAFQVTGGISYHRILETSRRSRFREHSLDRLSSEIERDTSRVAWERAGGVCKGWLVNFKANDLCMKLETNTYRTHRNLEARTGTDSANAVNKDGLEERSTRSLEQSTDD